MKQKSALTLRTTAALVMALATLGTTPHAVAQTDPVVLSFMTVGDSRQAPAKPDPT